MARKLERADDRERQLSDGGELSAPKDGPDRRSRLSRRSYLGAALVTALPASVGTVRAATVERHGIRFRRVLDAVDDLGMDPTGGTPVDPAIAAAGDGALIRFPDGVYRFDTDPGEASLDGETRGFEGTGDDVTFLAPQGRHGFLLDGVGMSGAYLDDVVVDRTAPDASVGIRLCGDRVVVRNLVARGACDHRDGTTPFLSVSTAALGAASLDGPDSAARRELLVENLERTSSRGDGVRDPVASEVDTLTIEGTGVATNYEITVDGRLEGKISPSGRWLSGSSSEGTIESDATSYTVDGTITDFRLDGDANVYLNDAPVDPDALGSRSPDRLVFDASGGTTSYAFSVEGLYPHSSSTAAPAAGERTAGNVSEGADVYRFDGNVEFLSVEGAATLAYDSGSEY